MNMDRDKERQLGWIQAKANGKSGFWLTRGSWLDLLDDLCPGHNEDYNTNGAFNLFKTVSAVKLSTYARLHYRHDFDHPLSWAPESYR
jgi:hypothetical protein